MNGFSDLHVAFDASGPPTRHRLDNRWKSLGDPCGLPWLGVATSEASAPIVETRAPGWRLWAVGEVFSYRRRTEASLQRFADDLAAGCADPALLDAHAVVFGWEASSRRLHVWTDRMGTIHAYYGDAAGQTSVGTCFAAVSQSSDRAIDWVGVTGFCGLGFYPADRTMFEDVRVLRPATWTVFDERGAVLSARRYWTWWYEPTASRTDDDLVDEFHDIWTRTIRDQCRGRPVVVPISGGLDSRTVLAAAVPSNGPRAGDPRVHAFTYGYSPQSPEIRISQRVARARGLRAGGLVVEPYLLDRIDEVDQAVEGFQALSFSRQAGVSGRLAAMGERVIGGHWGDVWFDRAGSGSDVLATALHKFSKPGGAWLLDHLCAPHLGGEAPRTVLRDLLRDELGRLPDLGDPDVSLTALKTDQWSFRWTLASVRAYQLGVPTLLPFYANEVVDFFLRVPPSQLAGRRLQIAYLTRHHPDLAAVPWQDTGMSLAPHAWEPAAALARRAAHKAVRTATRRPVTQRNWEVQYLTGSGPAAIRTMLLGAPSVPSQLIARATLEPLVEGFLQNPDGQSGYTVDALVTLATSLGSA